MPGFPFCPTPAVASGECWLGLPALPGLGLSSRAWCQVTPASRAGVSKEQVCHYRGQCVDAGNTHYCLCKEGYTGSYCESEVDHCQPGPCQHGATCRSYVGGYVCEVSNASHSLNAWVLSWAGGLRHMLS